jgi:hypothetical protein
MEREPERVLFLRYGGGVFLRKKGHKFLLKAEIRCGNIEISLVFSGELEYNNRECKKAVL